MWLRARREPPFGMPLRLWIALALQFAVLVLIFGNALDALGLNRESIPASVAAGVIGGVAVVWWMKFYARDWRLPAGFMLVLAVIGIAVWLIASLV